MSTLNMDAWRSRRIEPPVVFHRMKEQGSNVISSFFAHCLDEIERYIALTKQIIVSEPIEQLKIRFTPGVDQIFSEITPRLQIKRIYVLCLLKDLTKFLRHLEDGKFPNLVRLEINMNTNEGSPLNAIEIISQVFDDGGTLARLLSSPSCNKLETLGIEAPWHLPSRSHPYFHLLNLNRDRNREDWAELNTICRSKLGIPLSGLLNVFPIVGCSLVESEDLDILFPQCYRDKSQLDYLSGIEEAHRKSFDILNWISKRSAQPGGLYPPASWLAEKLKVLIPDMLSLAPDVYNPSLRSAVGFFSSVSRYQHAEHCPDLVEAFNSLVRVDGVSAARLMSHISTNRRCELFLTAPLEWKTRVVNVMVDQDPIWVHLLGFTQPLLELAQLPGFDCNQKCYKGETLLQALLAAGSWRMASQYCSPIVGEQLILTLLQDPSLDVSLVGFPLSENGADALMSCPAVLDVFPKYCKDWKTFLLRPFTSKCVRNPAWLKKVRLLLLAMADEEACKEFSVQMWTHLIKTESQAPTVTIFAKSMVDVFPSETPDFVYTIAHGPQKHFSMPSKMKFQNLKKCLQPIVPAHPSSLLKS